MTLATGVVARMNSKPTCRIKSTFQSRIGADRGRPVSNIRLRMLQPRMTSVFLGFQSPRSKPVADQRFVSEERILDFALLVISDLRLPALATDLCDAFDRPDFSPGENAC